MRGHHRQIPGHHASGIQLRVCGRYRRNVAGAKASRTHRRDRSSDARIVDVRHIREPGATMQRSNSTIAINVRNVDVGDIYATKAAAVSAPPWEEAVTRPNR
jgi:hypothetical protein